VQTPYQAEVLAKNGIAGDRILYDRGCYRPLPAGTRQGGSDGPHRFGYFGRMSAEKGLGVICEAMRRIPPGNCTLDVYGLDDEDAAELEQLVHDVPGCILRPAVPPEALPRALAGADCVLIPSLWLENHPTILTHALEAGIEAICSAVPSLSHLSGNAGVHFASPGDPRAWARAMSTRMRERCERASGRGLDQRYAFERLVALTKQAYGGARSCRGAVA
jgi:glycosyltransferase involved in cell wall biosynthesis